MSKPLYRLHFQHQDKLYVVYARRVASSNIWGFIEVGEFDFDTRQGVLVDPAEERLREEFADTRTLHLPMHNVLRIEEVERRGAAAIRDAHDAGRVVTPFPMPRQS
ncbi:MAG: DUF1820 family protein [Xanthomonadaceae bacterium]|nr:DUF1820 family protein [Xanthomonadaceae bacterium]